MSKQFPIMAEWEARKDFPGFTIPWEIIAPHEKQALENHCGQSLRVLARRGGLSRCEALAVLQDRDWKAMKLTEADATLRALIEATPQLPAVDATTTTESINTTGATATIINGEVVSWKQEAGK